MHEKFLHIEMLSDFFLFTIKIQKLKAKQKNKKEICILYEKKKENYYFNIQDDNHQSNHTLMKILYQ
jgi:hypothetical protein